MITVYNKQELQEALKNKGQKIRVEGSYANELAQKIHRKKKVSKAVMVGGQLLPLVDLRQHHLLVEPHLLEVQQE